MFPTFNTPTPTCKLHSTPLSPHTLYNKHTKGPSPHALSWGLLQDTRQRQPRQREGASAAVQARRAVTGHAAEGAAAGCGLHLTVAAGGQREYGTGHEPVHVGGATGLSGCGGHPGRRGPETGSIGPETGSLCPKTGSIGPVTVTGRARNWEFVSLGYCQCGKGVVTCTDVWCMGLCSYGVMGLGTGAAPVVSIASMFVCI
mmetsp:Transcript_9322/g.20454  ORF Transcript_9322/g.20454 Transcript_9322/m.20454 type:complete len:201 (-) Transcript_9322:189-791(-)